jgi:type I restriction enzyme S subunit
MSVVEGWKTASLGRVAHITMGQSPDSKYYSAEEKSGMPFLQGCAEFQSRFPASALFCSQVKKTANRGAILFSVRAPVGKINIADRDYIIGRGLAAILGIEVDQGYLEHYLVYVETRFRNASQGSTFEAINSSELNGWPIDYPPSKPEQAKIAEILSTVDRAIEQTEALIAKQQRIKTGLMQDLLTRGIDEHGNLRSEKTHKFKDSPLGRIPVEWEVKPVGELARVRSGATPSRSNTQFWDDGTIPWVKTGEVNFSDISETEEKVTELALKKLSLHLEPAGTVIVAMYGQGGTRGRCGFLGIAATTNQACASIYGSQEIILQRYLYQYLVSKYTELRTAGHGSNQLNLNGRLLSQFQMKLPPFSEQVRISNSFSAIDARTIQSHNQLRKLLSLRTALMQDLLTGKKRVGNLGNIVPQ